MAIKFFVFVLESPSANDVYDGRREGEVIKQAVELNNIPCIVKTAISINTFREALTKGVIEASV